MSVADLIIVPCRACGSEGRIYRQCSCNRRSCLGAPCEIDEGPCPDCDGTGGEMIEGEPITLDDIADAEIPIFADLE